jgi:hypothetical protein
MRDKPRDQIVHALTANRSSLRSIQFRASRHRGFRTLLATIARITLTIFRDALLNLGDT